MEYSLGISADNIHGSATGSQSGVDQEHPTRPITPESPTQSLLWPVEVLYEHDFYTDVWYTDMIACILILVYACGGIIVSASSTDSGRESVVMFITPPYGLTTLCTFCLYLFLYVLICIRSKLYPDMVYFRTTHTHYRRFGLLLLLCCCVYFFMIV
jgi:hypothetical protein